MPLQDTSLHHPVLAVQVGCLSSIAYRGNAEIDSKAKYKIASMTVMIFLEIVFLV